MDKNHTEASVQSAAGAGNIKEAVCVNALRVYDSCSRKQYSLLIQKSLPRRRSDMLPLLETVK